MRRRVAFALIVASTLVVSGQEKRLPKTTEAWKWTLEQRIATRLDPAGLDERRRVAALNNSDGPVTNPAQLVIEGSRNPELFLPHELMSFLITDVMLPGDDRHRATYDPVLADFNWEPATFWNDVRSAAADYLRLQDQVPGRGRSKSVSEQLCGLRAAALAEMRRKYPRFDEFLYVAVAPRKNLSAGDVPSAQWLFWLEAGCK
jgi:hypothetical protein